jgi:phosphatidylserine decarboxylase
LVFEQSGGAFTLSAMKHSGKARTAAFKMILITLILVAMVPIIGAVAIFIGGAMMTVSIFILVVWFIFALFTLYFFRDPTPTVPTGARMVVSPAHGKIDVIDKVTETQFMGGECQRISMFLSVIDVHVQNAPVGGKVSYVKYTEGQFLNAMKTECATCNENVLIGFESSDPSGVKVGLRLIAGVLARRIVPWVESGDVVARGDRISLIQFGSRCDVYLPLSATIKIKLGDRVVGGETVFAVLD